MAVKRTIALLGQPTYNEDGAAGEVLLPGHLVKGTTTILKHASAGLATPASFALERDELGRDIDGKDYRGTVLDYAVGDTVKVGSFKKGDHVLAFIASGQNIAADDKLESAGDGTLKIFSSGKVLARALETIATVTVLTRIRVEIM